MITSAQVPKNFQDLLKPDLKGKLAVTTESSSARVIGSMLKYKGDGFMKKLKEQEVRLFKLASLGFLNLLIADGFSEPSDRHERKRRAHRLGATGRGCGKCGWIGRHHQCTPSPRGFVAHRLCHRCRGSKVDGTVSIRRRME